MGKTPPIPLGVGGWVRSSFGQVWQTGWQTEGGGRSFFGGSLRSTRGLDLIRSYSLPFHFLSSAHVNEDLQCGATISCNPWALEEHEKVQLGFRGPPRVPTWRPSSDLQPTNILGCKGKCLFLAGGWAHIPPPPQGRWMSGWVKGCVCALARAPRDPQKTPGSLSNGLTGCGLSLSVLVSGGPQSAPGVPDLTHQ